MIEINDKPINGKIVIHFLHWDFCISILTKIMPLKCNLQIHVMCYIQLKTQGKHSSGLNSVVVFSYLDTVILFSVRYKTLYHLIILCSIK
jgi:hypothetical protein